jgi:hypothetical protein
MKETTVDIFDKYIDSILDDVHTILPGKIELYYGHSQRKAKVKPLTKIRNSNNQLIDINPIDNVPVVFPSSSEFSMLFPLKKNDGVLLLFSESAIGEFLNGDGNRTVDTDDQRRFDLTDCIAIPGLWSLSAVPTIPENNNDFFILFGNAKIQINKNTGYITLTDGTNTIETGPTSVKINNNLEVLQ